QIANHTKARLAQPAMQIGADDIRNDSFAHGTLYQIEIKMTAGVTDVEDHAAFLSFAHLGQQLTLLVDNRRLLRRVTVRDHITGPELPGNLVHADRRVADVNHDRRAGRLAGLDRQAQRSAAILTDGFLVHADFDADADVAVITNRFGGAVRIRKAEIEQFARRVQHPVLRQSYEAQHSRFGLLVDQFAEAEEIDRPGGARVHCRGHAGGETE